MTKTVVISVLGTHGDVQPFVALSMALKKRGFRPIVCTTDDFADFVTEHGIEFRGLGSDMRAMLKRTQLDDAAAVRMLLYAPSLLRDGQRMLKEAARRTFEAAKEADAIVFASTTTFCIDIAEALHIVPFMAALQPLNPTDEFPYFQYEFSPVGPMMFRFNRQPFARVPNIDPVLNKLSYFVQRAHQTYYDLPRDRLRRSLLGLRARNRGGFYKNARGETVTALHAYSPSISPAPGDWPDNNVITGYWRLEDITDWKPSPEFEEFLSKGPAPVYLGFGSMPWGAQRNSEIITKALSAWGGRAIVAKGWGGVKPEALPDSVFVIDRAPHTKLFNYVSAVVHHGGAGTTQAGLEAGKPSFAVPQFFDQPYWGRLIYELGCGPPPVKLKKLTPQILAAALEDLTNTPSYARAAEAISDKMRLEDGTNRAVDVIEETIAAQSGAALGGGELLEAAL
ncbi:MAG: glycosyltransferase [Devosia sp.]